jgi:hypothetical protein
MADLDIVALSRLGRENLEEARPDVLREGRDRVAMRRQHANRSP